MALTIDELQIEIQQKSTTASNGLDKLAVSLNSLRSAAKGGVGLTVVAKQLNKLNTSLAAIQGLTKISELVSGLNQLSGIQKASGFTSAINQLGKIPKITKELNSKELSKFGLQIRLVTKYIQPLATEMEKVSNGFSRLPANIQKSINANAKLTTSNSQARKSYGILGTGISAFNAKLMVFFGYSRRIVGAIGGWINKSNEYQENLNLFRVSMGGYYDEALKYAKQVENVLGVAHSEWIRYQAVFQNMAEGFGIAGDKALIMSKNLTQMGYDLGSVFNVDFDTAMEKLESALSGQPRPMREWGFDLSEASLKAVALSKGIDKNVESMTQSEKAQLRYIQLFETMDRLGLSGDLKRTIEAPANALRVLSSNAALAARELGNIFIPLLNKVLPYVTAFVKLVRWVASEIAALFGFELTEVDYSGLENVSMGAEDIENTANDATGAVKKLKNAVLGFDELNVIDPTNGSGSGNGGSTAGGGFDLPLPDNSNWLDGALTQKAEELFAVFKENLPEIRDWVLRISAAIAAIKVIDWKKILNGAALPPVVKDVISKIPAAILIGVGVYLLFNTFKDIFKDGFTAENVISGILDSFVVGAGIVALTGSTMAGLTFTLGTSLLFLIGGYDYALDQGKFKAGSMGAAIYNVITSGVGSALGGILALSLNAPWALGALIGLTLTSAVMLQIGTIDAIQKGELDANSIVAKLRYALSSALAGIAMVGLAVAAGASGGALAPIFLVTFGVSYLIEWWLGTDEQKEREQKVTLQQKSLGSRTNFYVCSAGWF